MFGLVLLVLNTLRCLMVVLVVRRLVCNNRRVRIRLRLVRHRLVLLVCLLIPPVNVRKLVLSVGDMYECIDR